MKELDSMTVQRAAVGGASQVVTATGEVDVLTAPRLGEAVRLAIEEPGTGRVVVDLGGLTFLGLHGLRVLLDMNCAAVERGVQLRVVTGGSRSVLRLLEITHLIEVLAVDETVGVALESAVAPGVT